MEVENFFGCYLLYCLNERYKGRVYIGFTVDPNRRIKQHNKGLKAGGAWKTSNKGPWEMVLIVHGFPNEVSALRFEWAWQHPDKSRRLRHVPKKAPRENAFKYRFRVMTEMLQVGPWTRLPLTVRWLNEQYRLNFEVTKLPPVHMPICSGHVRCHKVRSEGTVDDEDESELLKTECFECGGVISSEDKRVSCFHPDCRTVFHIGCLAKQFLSDSPNCLIPVEGKCSNCTRVLLWGDIVRYSLGCYHSEIDSASQIDTNNS